MIWIHYSVASCAVSTSYRARTLYVWLIILGDLILARPKKNIFFISISARIEFDIHCTDYFFFRFRKIGFEFRNLSIIMNSYSILAFINCISWQKLRLLRRASSNLSTTLITAMGCRQCLPLSVFQLKSKHCRNGVVDTFGQRNILHKNEETVLMNF